MTDTTLRVQIPPGVDAEFLRDCVLIRDGVAVTADDPDWLTVSAATEAAAAAVATDTAEWVRRALRT